MKKQPIWPYVSFIYTWSMKHPKQRFIDRIWKTIYRDNLKCTCEDCQKNCFEIQSMLHAINLYDYQNEMDIEYRDTGYETD